MGETDAETIGYITVEAVIAVLSVLGNSLVCYIVIKCDSLRKKVRYTLC